jgi:hypothetical protein
MDFTKRSNVRLAEPAREGWAVGGLDANYLGRLRFVAMPAYSMFAAAVEPELVAWVNQRHRR